MKIIVDDLISTVATDGSELSATNYPIENTLTDFPTQVFIASTPNPTSDHIITVSLSADADGLFLFNWLADTITISTDGGSGYSAPDNDFISDNYFLKTGSDILTKPIFFPTSATSANGYRIKISSSVDRKAQQAKGAAISQFDVDTGSTGRFEDSGGTTINLDEHGGVFVGSYVNLGGTFHQVTKIIGDGTASGAVTLSGTPVDSSVTALYNPLKVGIIKAGNIETFDNPSLGLQRSFSDYGVKRITSGGLSSFRQGNHSQFWQGSMVSDVSTSDSFFELARALRGKPFPCLIANGMPAGQTENVNYSMYAQFTEMPDISFGGSQGATRFINFRLKEFL